MDTITIISTENKKRQNSQSSLPTKQTEWEERKKCVFRLNESNGSRKKSVNKKTQNTAPNGIRI